MSEYIYPAIFHSNSDGSYTITYPDLPGCISEGKDIGNALYMAEDALKQWLSYLSDKGKDIPVSSDISTISVDKNEFINLVRVELRDNKAVRRTVSIPKWMDELAMQSGLSLSRILQEALKEKIAL